MVKSVKSTIVAKSERGLQQQIDNINSVTNLGCEMDQGNAIVLN